MADSTAIVDGSGHTTSKKRKVEDMETSEPTVVLQRNAKIVDLLPQADVILQVGQGEDAVDIGVSSHVLCLASKVYSTMLNSPFLESSTKVVGLTEDDPQTILDFCHIIHHQYGSVKDMTAKRLRGLMIVADMRDCRESLQSWISATIQDYTKWVEDTVVDTPTSTPIPFPTSIEGLLIEDIIAFAYIFEIESLFRNATEICLFGTGRDNLPTLPAEVSLDSIVPIQSQGQCLYGETTLCCSLSVY